MRLFAKKRYQKMKIIMLVKLTQRCASVDNLMHEKIWASSRQTKTSSTA